MIPRSIIDMNALASALVDLFFPSYCSVCDEAVSITRNYLCTACVEALNFYKPQCTVCGSAIVDNQCGFCSTREVFFDRHYSIFDYSEHLQKIIFSMKYEKKERLARAFGKLLLNYIQQHEELLLFCESAYIVAVPMHRRKKTKRGFNQSEITAAYLAKNGGFIKKEILFEKKPEKAQKDMTYQDRFIHTIGKYGVKNPRAIAGHNVLLVDDIFTTGATVNECARILKKHGAEHVFSITIGRTMIKKLEN